jgi:site-specific recombinase XerD
MVDRKNRVIAPEGGRLKTQNTNEEQLTQVAPLTNRALEILDEIEAEKKKGAIINNIKGLLFTREDGRHITREMISRAVKRAWKTAQIKSLFSTIIAKTH